MKIYILTLDTEDNEILFGKIFTQNYDTPKKCFQFLLLNSTKKINFIFFLLFYGNILALRYTGRCNLMDIKLWTENLSTKAIQIYVRGVNRRLSVRVYIVFFLYFYINLETRTSYIQLYNTMSVHTIIKNITLWNV